MLIKTNDGTTIRDIARHNFLMDVFDFDRPDTARAIVDRSDLDERKPGIDKSNYDAKPEVRNVYDILTQGKVKATVVITNYVNLPAPESIPNSNMGALIKSDILASIFAHRTDVAFTPNGDMIENFYVSMGRDLKAKLDPRLGGVLFVEPGGKLADAVID